MLTTGKVTGLYTFHELCQKKGNHKLMFLLGNQLNQFGPVLYMDKADVCAWNQASYHLYTRVYVYFLDFSFCFIGVCLTHTKTPQKPNCKIFLIHYKIIALEINRLLYDSSSQYLWYGCCPYITVRSSPWKSNETANAHSTPGLWFQSGPKYKILKSLIMPCSEAWSSSTEDSPWPQSQMQTPVGCGHTGTRG